MFICFGVNYDNKILKKVCFTENRDVVPQAEIISNSATKSTDFQRIPPQNEKIKSKDEKRSKKDGKTSQLVLQSTLEIRQFNLYWVKLRGFCMWPATVEEVIGSNRFIVHFFGDYTRSIVYRNSFLYKFNEGFVVFNGDQKMVKNVKLSKSVNEASMCYMRLVHSPPKSCCICDSVK